MRNAVIERMNRVRSAPDGCRHNTPGNVRQPPSPPPDPSSHLLYSSGKQSTFHFDDRDSNFAERFVRIRLVGGEDDASGGQRPGEWSAPFLLDTVGELYLKLRHRKTDKAALVLARVGVSRLALLPIVEPPLRKRVSLSLAVWPAGCLGPLDLVHHAHAGCGRPTNSHRQLYIPADHLPPVWGEAPRRTVTTARALQPHAFERKRLYITRRWLRGPHSRIRYVAEPFTSMPYVLDWPSSKDRDVVINVGREYGRATDRLLTLGGIPPVRCANAQRAFQHGVARPGP